MVKIKVRGTLSDISKKSVCRYTDFPYFRKYSEKISSIICAKIFFSVINMHWVLHSNTEISRDKSTKN